jgi:hypothetical protein
MKNVSQLLLHIIVLMDLPINSGSEKYYPYLAPVNLSATYNFILQAIGDKLGMEVANAGTKTNMKKILAPITTVNDKPLMATIVIHQMVCIGDSAKVKQSHALNFDVADIAL